MEAQVQHDLLDLIQQLINLVAHQSLLVMRWLESFLVVLQINISLPPTHARLVQVQILETARQQPLEDQPKFQKMDLALTAQEILHAQIQI